MFIALAPSIVTSDEIVLDSGQVYKTPSAAAHSPDMFIICPAPSHCLPMSSTWDAVVETGFAMMYVPFLNICIDTSETSMANSSGMPMLRMYSIGPPPVQVQVPTRHESTVLTASQGEQSAVLRYVMARSCGPSVVTA